MTDYLHEFLYSIYSYICLVVLLLGSLIRFDRGQYTWKNDTLQMLRRGTLHVGSNLFHWGILVVVVGYFVGFLVPHWMVSSFLSAPGHQLLAMVGGGAAGIVSIIGLTMLIHRRLPDTRVRRNSRTQDIVVVLMLWVQLALGLGTMALSMRYMDGALPEVLTGYVKGVITFRPGIARLLDGVSLTYQLHILFDFTIFPVTPFMRMVHIWSGFVSLAYLIRPYQLVRKRQR